jgi:carbonic anhydrase
MVGVPTNELFKNNREWAKRRLAESPDFFQKLIAQQSPEFLWVGCSDSRVPANEIVGLLPGELFVHRNVANLVVHTDLNCLSVLQFAVDVLKVKHVIVCGHYGCGGVRAALNRDRLGLIDNWLRHVVDVAEQHQAMLASVEPVASRVDRLCELNVIEQVRHVCQTSIVEAAWSRGQSLAIHGWVYGLHDGHLRDLEATTRETGGIESSYERAVAGVAARAAGPAAIG